MADAISSHPPQMTSLITARDGDFNQGVQTSLLVREEDEDAVGDDAAKSKNTSGSHPETKVNSNQK